LTKHFSLVHFVGVWPVSKVSSVLLNVAPSYAHSHFYLASSFFFSHFSLSFRYLSLLWTRFWTLIVVPNVDSS
jgi:hypothetical protein